jgi:hypothetical protein
MFPYYPSCSKESSDHDHGILATAAFPLQIFVNLIGG